MRKFVYFLRCYHGIWAIASGHASFRLTLSLFLFSLWFADCCYFVSWLVKVFAYLLFQASADHILKTVKSLVPPWMRLSPPTFGLWTASHTSLMHETWLRIIHWVIWWVFTIQWRLYHLLHAQLPGAAVSSSFRNFPQFDGVAPLLYSPSMHRFGNSLNLCQCELVSLCYWRRRETSQRLLANSGL